MSIQTIARLFVNATSALVCLTGLWMLIEIDAVIGAVLMTLSVTLFATPSIMRNSNRDATDG